MKNCGLEPKDVEVSESKDKEFNIDDAKPSSSGGRPAKPFDQLKRKSQLKILKPEYERTKKFAKKRNLTVNKALAYLGELDANKEFDEERARMFKAIRDEENPLSHKRMDVEKAVAIQVRAGLSRTPWEIVRQGFSDSTSVPSK